MVGLGWAGPLLSVSVMQKWLIRKGSDKANGKCNTDGEPRANRSTL